MPHICASSSLLIELKCNLKGKQKQHAVKFSYYAQMVCVLLYSAHCLGKSPYCTENIVCYGASWLPFSWLLLISLFL